MFYMSIHVCTSVYTYVRRSIGSTPLLLAESGSSEILKEDLATVLQEVSNAIYLK